MDPTEAEEVERLCDLCERVVATPENFPQGFWTQLMAEQTRVIRSAHQLYPKWGIPATSVAGQMSFLRPED